MKEPSQYTISEPVLGAIPRVSALEEVLGRIERGDYVLPIGERRITLSPAQRLGAGGEGVTYRSGDDRKAAVKLRPVLSGLPPLPQFGEGPVPVACSFQDGTLQLQRLPSGPKVAIRGLEKTEQGAYQRAHAEQTISHICSGIPGAVEFIDGTYILVVEKSGSQLLAGMLTKLIEGKTLSEHLHDGDLSLQEKLQIIAQVGDTLREYQRRSIVHGDIKPGNIIIDGRKRPTLIDHGISQPLFGDSKDLGLVCGTPDYLAPETAAEQFHRNTDFYSLGLIACELLMGGLPYPPQADGKRATLWHYIRLQELFYETEKAEQFCWRVRKLLGEQGYPSRLAWSIAGALYGQPRYRETSLPNVAWEYATELEANKGGQRSELPTERITVKEPLFEMRRQAKEPSIQLELTPDMEILEDPVFPQKRDD